MIFNKRYIPVISLFLTVMVDSNQDFKKMYIYRKCEYCNYSPLGILCSKSYSKVTFITASTMEGKGSSRSKIQICHKMSTHMLLTTMECGKPKSKYYAKASVGNAALAFDHSSTRKIVLSKHWSYGIMPSHY